MHLSTPTNVFVSVFSRAHSSCRPRATRTGSGYQNPTSNLPHRSVLSSDHLIYFLNLTVTVFVCFAPLLGVNIKLDIRLQLPGLLLVQHQTHRFASTRRLGCLGEALTGGGQLARGGDAHLNRRRLTLDLVR